MTAPMAGEPLSLDQFRQYIGKMGWPVAPNVIAEQAKRHGAPDEIVAALGQLPNRIYMSDKDAWQEFLKAARSER